MLPLSVCMLAMRLAPRLRLACPPSPPTCLIRMTAEPPSKFIALMAGEDAVRPFELDPVVSRPVAWRRSRHATTDLGERDLTAEISDPAAPHAPPREVHLAKGLLSRCEVSALRSAFDALGSGSAAEAGRILGGVKGRGADPKAGSTPHP